MEAAVQLKAQAKRATELQFSVHYFDPSTTSAAI